MTKNSKVIGVSIIASVLLVASVINNTSSTESIRSRNLLVENNNENVFANEEEISSKLDIKPYEQRDNLPCVPDNSPKDQGIFYIKVPKTSSSTLAGITSRMAAKESQRQGFVTDKVCKTHDPMVHSSASALKTARRDKEKSFLWTVIRHPNDRAVSHFGMRLKFGNVESHPKIFRQDLLENASYKVNTQLAFMTTKTVKDFALKDDQITEIVQDVLDEYDFVGIYERLHESLVVMSMLTNMNINDVIFNYRPIKNARCGSLDEPDWLKPGMRNYLQSAEWGRRQKADFIMYKALNKKLDMTIDALGREEVHKKVADFEKLLYLGTELSSKIRKQTGCGVLFPTIYGDITDLENFSELAEEEQKFVKGTLN